MKSRFVALAVLAVAGSAVVALPPNLAVAIVAYPLVAVLVGPRLEMTRVGQAVMSILAALAGLLTPRMLIGVPLLHDITLLSERTMLAVFPLVAIASARCLVKDVRMGARLTLTAAFVALIASGGALSGPMYPVMAALFFVLALLGLAHDDPHRFPRVRVTLRGTVAVVLPLVVCAGLALSSHRFLPEIHRSALAKLRDRMRYSTVGFSEYLDLGSMYGMLTDSRIVLRVRGEGTPALLRGIVFTRYDYGRWTTKEVRALPTIVESQGERPTGRGWVELEHARRPERYFLPGDAEAIRTSAGYATHDRYAIYSPPEDQFAKRVWFRQGQGVIPAPPGADELVLAGRLRARFVPLLKEWRADRGTPTERLRAIERNLQARYTYRLRIERHGHSAPLLDFLFDHKEGHCEYFASAMALLARAVDVPTRVVSGYRVAERSRFGYEIVRRSHAHSWVEAWVEGRWLTFDPTPPDPLAAGSDLDTPLVGALTDVVATSWEVVDDWLEQRTGLEFGFMLILLGGTFVLVRVLRGRQERRRAQSADLPLDGFVRLGARLERLGFARSPSETLESYAGRIEATEQISGPTSRAVADALRAYGDLRYARVGDPDEINERLYAVAASME